MFIIRVEITEKVFMDKGHSKVQCTSPAERYPSTSNRLPIFRLVEACDADRQCGEKVNLFDSL